MLTRAGLLDDALHPSWNQRVQGTGGYDRSWRP